MRVLLVVVLAACSANDDVPAPRVAGITPDHAPVGALVMVTGEFFCAQPEDDEGDPLRCDVIGAVSFDTATAAVAGYTDTLITAEVPDAPRGRTQVTVIVGGRLSNRVGFTIE
jgi:hypothetical protein